MADTYDRDKPFQFCKLDIKDGFWRMVVSYEDAWNFCYILPAADGTMKDIDDAEIVVPHALQMGWCESPPFFCASSETARDVIEQLVINPIEMPARKFESRLRSDQPIIESKPENTKNVIEDFVDDFIGEITEAHLTHLSRCMLHGIHSVFPPIKATQHGGGDAISEQKIDKGEGRWDYVKEILGWNFDGKNFTIQLPSDKCDKIVERLKKVKKFKRKIPRKVVEKIEGSLQHATFGIPRGSGLFSLVQMAMQGGKQ